MCIMVIIMVICFIVAGQNNFASTELAEMVCIISFYQMAILIKGFRASFMSANFTFWA